MILFLRYAGLELPYTAVVLPIYSIHTIGLQFVVDIGWLSDIANRAGRDQCIRTRISPDNAARCRRQAHLIAGGAVQKNNERLLRPV
jgi:hypothetical protein